MPTGLLTQAFEVGDKVHCINPVYAPGAPAVGEIVSVPSANGGLYYRVEFPHTSSSFLLHDYEMVLVTPAQLVASAAAFKPGDKVIYKSQHSGDIHGVVTHVTDDSIMIDETANPYGAVKWQVSGPQVARIVLDGPLPVAQMTGCTCDFSGANCWAGCRCGYLKRMGG